MRCRIRAAAAILIAAAAVLLPASRASADQDREQQWHLRALNVAAAHRVSTGAGVTVAVIDTGVEPHPDLRRNLLSGADATSQNQSNGQEDRVGHGTGMAGVIAAHGKSRGNGILGIAPGAKILPIRCQRGDRPAASEGEAVAAGVEWAVANGAKVINLSFAAGPSARLTRAIDAARAADVVIVAAAGNRPRDFLITVPAVLPGVVAVGATSRNGNKASVSVSGSQLSLMAPGVEIYSTGRDGKYRRSTAGTSSSSAIVAGAAALVRSKFPDLSAAEVVHRLTATATDKGAPGRDREYGYGVVNLVAALTADVPPLAASGAPATPSASAVAPIPSSTPDVAAPPSSEPDNRSFAVGGGIGVVLLLGAVLVALLIRRRRHAPPA
ncbi:MAG TPA: type VII secretion-associated serine protease mycosin [Pilimelia sp.]|nr:type VII secretion-associated serine protease mycosin [Pilimelia sp.]